MSDVSRYGVTENAEVDATKAQMIARGDFSGYHLARARELLAEGKFKDAIYQASASLSHDPHNAAARAVRAEAKSKSKEKA